MKFSVFIKYLIIFFISLNITQLVKADLASDLLKKAQDLSEKQKIKGKKLEVFILSNTITVDYEGKEQTYKFNKDITYEVYENSKVIGDGTWTIKGLTKSSIKLSGYKNIYFQIYNSKDKISTLTNLKKKSDSQTNRKILKISSLDDFEKQLTNSITKKEKKKVVKKEEVKKEEVKKIVKKEEIKENISVADINNKNDLSKYLIKNGLRYMHTDGSGRVFTFFPNGKATFYMESKKKETELIWEPINKNTLRAGAPKIVEQKGWSIITLDFEKNLVFLDLTEINGNKFKFRMDENKVVKKEVVKKEVVKKKVVKNNCPNNFKIDDLPIALKALHFGKLHLHNKNYDHATMLFIIAAEQGSATAQIELANIYSADLDVGYGEERAIMWYAMSLIEHFRIDGKPVIENSFRTEDISAPFKDCYEISEQVSERVGMSWVYDGPISSKLNRFNNFEYFLGNTPNDIKSVKKKLQTMYDYSNLKVKYKYKREDSSKDRIKMLIKKCWDNKFKRCDENVGSFFSYNYQTDYEVLNLRNELIKEYNLYPDVKVNKKEEVKLSKLASCPEYDANVMYQLKWTNCFGERRYKDTYTFRTYKYLGEFFNNEPNGTGSLTYDVSKKDEIVRYVGEFKNGKIEGQGIAYYDNGNKYEGFFKNNRFSGIGKLTSNDGTIIESGEWEKGKLVETKIIKLLNSDQLKTCASVEELFKKNYSEKTKTLGGYKHIHFGMSRKDVYQIIDCKKIKIFDRDGFDGNAGTGTRGIVLKELYKYPLGVVFIKNEAGPGSTVDKLSLEVLTTIRTKERYSFGSSGIQEFEELKKALSNKYKLKIEPSENSIDKYNNAAVSGTLNWVFNDNDSKNLIILSLRGVKSKDFVNYMYFGEVQYLSLDQSKNYLNKIDGNVIKSDDL